MNTGTQLAVRTSCLDQEKSSLLDQRQKLISSFVKAAERKQSSKMARVFQQLRQTNDFLVRLERIERQMPKKSSLQQYAISSLFLHECFKLLTADQDEQFSS